MSHGSGNAYFRTPEGYFGQQEDEIDELKRRLARGPDVPPFPAAGSIRSAFLPASYRGWGPTAVVIDGVLSTDAYKWGTPYEPNAARMVRLISDGTTWIIMGQITDETVRLAFNSAVVTIYGDRASDATWNLRPRATKLGLSGLVVLSGMFTTVGSPASGALVATLPEGFRPDQRVLHTIEYGDTAKNITIETNGQIVLSSAPPSANAYVSLDGVAFHAAGAGTWTLIGQGGSAWNTTYYEDWPGGFYGTSSFYKDPWGFTWFKGVARQKANPPADNTNMLTLPATHRSHLEAHIRSGTSWSADSHGLIGAQPTNGLNWKVGMSNQVGVGITLAGVALVTTDALTLNPWKDIVAWNNGWRQYTGGAQFTKASYVRRADGLVMLKGLVADGTNNTKQTVMAEEEVWPAGGRIILPAVAAQLRARMEVLAARDIDAANGPGGLLGRGSSVSWFAWDSLKWVP